MSLQNSPPGLNVNTTNAADTSAVYAFNIRVLLGALIVLVAVIFFMLMIHVYARWFLRRSSSPFVSSQGVAAPAFMQHYDSTGLDTAAIAQLPTFIYKASSPVDHLEAGKLHDPDTMPAPECAVCLSEFQANEKGRMLPACKHMFHTECIDKWLFEHVTCPLCRTNVIPAIAASTETTSTDQQHQEQEAIEPSQGTSTEGNSVTIVEYPCNVLFWGNQSQVVLSQVPSTSSSPALLPSMRRASARALPQITIDIPPIQGNLLVNASYGCLSAKCTMEQEACSSQPLKSPSLHASIKRILSRQFSRQKSPSEEGNEESPK